MQSRDQGGDERQLHDIGLTQIGRVGDHGSDFIEVLRHGETLAAISSTPASHTGDDERKRKDDPHRQPTEVSELADRAREEFAENARRA